MNTETPNLPNREDDLTQEQEFVSHAYSVLDSMRTDYREAQRRIEAQGAWGSPQARTERDAQASHFGDQAMRLEQIQDHLVFGRVDMTDANTHYIGRAGLPDSTGGRLLIDWRAPAAQIERRVRAFDPFPGASTTLGGDTVKVWGSQIDSCPRRPDVRDGQIVFINDEGIGVACGEGCLLLTELQRPGGKRLAARDFLRGFPLAPGQRFGAEQTAGDAAPAAAPGAQP